VNKKVLFYLSISLLVCSFSFLIFVFYKDQIFNEGSRSNYYKVYYLLGILLLCYSIINLFLKENIRIHSLTIIISFILAFYLIEFLLLITGVGNLSNESVNKKILQEKIKIKKDYDTRSLTQFYDDKYSKDKNIVISMYPDYFLKHNNLKIYPLSGISNRETILCNENGYYAIYQSDRYGFNNPDNLWNYNEIDFVMFGDSFLHGSCVNEKDSITGQFKNILPKKTALNLGIGSTGPLIQLATLKEYLPLIKTKNILWFYYEGNDLRNLKSELQNKILLKYLNNENFTQNLKDQHKKIDNILLKILNKKRTPTQLLENNRGFYSFLKLTFLRRYIFSFFDSFNKKDVVNSDNDVRSLIKIIKAAKKISKNNNSNFYFVYIPDIRRLDLNEIDSAEYKKYNLIKNKLKESDVKIIDLYEELFQKIENPLVLYPFKLKAVAHFSEYGNKLIAETLRNNLSNYSKEK